MADDLAKVRRCLQSARERLDEEVKLHEKNTNELLMAREEAQAIANGEEGGFARALSSATADYENALRASKQMGDILKEKLDLMREIEELMARFENLK